MKKRILSFIMGLVVLASCSSSKKFQAGYAEDKPLFAAINELSRRPGNEKAQNDLRILYNKSVERHEEAIEAYKISTEEKKWDQVLQELNALQHIYNSLQATPGSSSIVKPKNYLKAIETTKAGAAEDFYVRAENKYAENNRPAYLEAWNYFKRSTSYITGYKDSEKRGKEAYEKSIVNVVINPIEEDNIFSSGRGSWNFPDLSYRPQEYQDALVRDLGGRSASYFPARFYNDRDIQRERIRPDWEIGIQWRNINPLQSIPRQFNRQASRSVENGKDTSGKVIYKTVYATLYITENNYNVQGNLEYRVMETSSRTSIDNGYIRDEVSWNENSATYTGDSRALSQEDWRMVNSRSGFNQPTRGDVLNSLMRKMYPELKRRIQQSID